MANEGVGLDGMEDDDVTFDVDEVVDLDDIGAKIADTAGASEGTEPAAKPQDGKPASPPQDASQPATDGSTEAKPTGETAPADSPAASAEDEPDDASEAEYPEWAYAADGGRHAVPGTAHGENGVFFPVGEPMQWLQQMLATAHAHNSSWRRELANAKAEGESALKEAHAIKAGSDVITAKLMELAEGDEEAAYEGFQDFRAQLPRLLLEAEKAQIAAAKSRQSDEESTKFEAELEDRKAQSLDRLVEHFARQPEYAGVDARAVRQRLERLRPALFSISSKDGRARTLDDVVVHTDVVEEEFKTRAALLSRTKAAEGQRTAAQEANREAVTEAKAPRVPGTRGAPAATTTPKMPKFKTQEEMDEWLQSSAADKWAATQLAAME